MRKMTLRILCIVGFIGFLFLAYVLTDIIWLHIYIGIHIYWLPLVLCGAAYLILVLFALKPFNAKKRRIAILSLSGIIVLLIVIFSPSVYRSLMPQEREEIDLDKYAPFGTYVYINGILTYQETLVAKLSEESTLKISGELPRLDGATALYPLYSAFVRATYPAPDLDAGFPDYSRGNFRQMDRGITYLVVSSRTQRAFENLVKGYADIVFLMGVSEEQREMAEENGLELILTPIGREAFVFFVNRRNPVSNLSVDDVRGIYSGEITNWQEVGGRNNSIRAFQRPGGSGSQTMLREIMGDAPLVPAPLNDTYHTMMWMYLRVAGYRNFRNSLGYSFLYYIRDMIGENRVKILSIDGVEPTTESIASGAYPFANDFYSITVRSDGEYLNAERTENIDKLIEWIRSPQGQYLVEATGYVPLP